MRVGHRRSNLTDRSQHEALDWKHRTRHHRRRSPRIRREVRPPARAQGDPAVRWERLAPDRLYRIPGYALRLGREDLDAPTRHALEGARALRAGARPVTDRF